PGLALLLAVEGAERHPSLLANNALLAALDACREERTLLGHTASVTDACFSPDGRRILTASEDGTARIWNADTGLSLRVFQGHTAGVGTARFSPDGQRVLTTSADGTVRVWEADTGRQLAMFEERGQPWTAPASFSPDGRRVLTVANVVRVRDADTGKELLALEDQRADGAVFSPDGMRLLTWSAGEPARIHDAAKGQLHFVLDRKDGDLVRTACWSTDGRRVVTLGTTPTVWNAITGEQMATLRWPIDQADFLRLGVFSPDGMRLGAAHGFGRMMRNGPLMWDVFGG